MKMNVDNYMDFVGVLVDVKRNFLGKTMCLTLTSGEGTVQVNAGAEMVARCKVGNIYTIGYVDRTMTNIKSGICESAR